MNYFNQINKSSILYTFVVFLLTFVGIIFLLNDIEKCFQSNGIDKLRLAFIVLSGVLSSLVWSVIFYRTFENFRKKEETENDSFLPSLLRRLSYIYLLTFWCCLILSSTGLNRMFFTLLGYYKTKNLFGLPFLFLALVIFLTYLDYAKCTLKDNANKSSKE